MFGRQGFIEDDRAERDWLAIASTLFLCMFAAQAAVLVLSPVLTDVAREFGVSTAVAGQLRSLSGVAAGIVALFATRLASRFGLERLLRGGLLLLCVASFASAVAPSFVALAAAQVALGAALACILSGAVAAADEWPPEAARRRVLSWALNGQPSAWVIGMPLIGVVAAISWRLAWLVVPLGSALLALLVLRRVPATPTPTRSDGATTTITHVLRRRAVARWAVGEVLAFAAWAGTLVFAGSLFVQSYGASPGLTALLLGAGAVAYLPGNLLARRAIDGASARPLALLAALASVVALAFGAVRPSIGFSAVAFGALAMVAGARTFGGSIRGMTLAPDAKVAVTGLRAAATQFGYLLGSVLGGAALAAGGYPGLAVMLASLFALAALPHLGRRESGVAETFTPIGRERYGARTRAREGALMTTTIGIAQRERPTDG